MVDIEVVNIVASASVGSKLDLEKIAAQVEDVDYDPKRFPGAICRIKEPKTAMLLFASGKIVCTGARRLEDVRSVIEMIMKKLEAIGGKVDTSPEITVQNIVATCDLKIDQQLKLSQVAISLGLENIEYEPEQFPGLVYRVAEPKAVALLFSTGKMVCTGAKRMEDIERAVEVIADELRGAGFL